VADQPIARVLTESMQALAPVLWFFMESTMAKREGDPTICDLVYGNPHDMALPELVETLQRWAVPQSKDWFAYKTNEQPARETAAATQSALVGTTFDPEDIFLTPGAFGALSVALRAVVDPGDEVLYLSPPWFFYESMIMVAGGRPMKVVLQPPTFELDVEAITAAITPKTRAIIVNSPNNPSGRIYPASDLAALASVLSEASERNGRTIYMLSDESYRRILFDGNAFESPAKHYPSSFVIYTYGKTLLAPGQRIGYIALHPEIQRRDELRQGVFLSQVLGGFQFPNSVLQYAVPELEDLSVDIPQLQGRRDRLHDALREMGYDINSPASTFYMLARSPLEDDVAFTEMLAEHDVFVLPGKVFELPGWFRISVTANDDMVERSLPGFEKALTQARG
jgi:aspartate aminotransferase